jgi:predicted RNase H-like HicB family nuclease
MVSYSAVLLKEDNFYIAKCPEVGTISQGKTVESAIKNLKEATELYLEEFPQTKSTKPILTTFEVANLAHA